ncbi:unnamed protein product [Meloidogyne enterolobii]|uniref:Uncharacterized protein n=1 Tax=Meloidogyne enterolobii TaxID=390850 RepID=A0ACB1B203_MELEN
MQNQNKDNLMQSSNISSIFPRLQSPQLFLPHPHFPYPYQSIFFRPFVLQRSLVPQMNLFLPPLPFIRFRPITIPEKEKKLISKLSIESIISSSEDENIKNAGQNRGKFKKNYEIKMLLGLAGSLMNLHKSNSVNSSESSKNGEIIKELNKISMLSQQKKERPKASFEPTSDEDAQIKASEACSSGAVESNRGYACHRCGKLFSYAYYRSFEKRDRLRIHILHVHERRRPHVCQICNKAFSQSSSLSKA